ncbi:autotransporter-associated beta strand repeat-containing protein [Prosthecobacter sp.]|uniref:beta strand repeat-containing protein n=1 Tax=Prosthecobacter sp. TaxID=1965333 RepID=UPI001DAEE0C9|nr:autotransporter-associated beta strand repeat-containing protein [Prosthecobacter sp.]MCB1276144.1 autotransporter-associated beta strand repeat-containing protein [Prosthecobacter sp.]
MMHRFIFACLLLSSHCLAANVYWDGSNSGDWTDVENWTSALTGGSTPSAVPGSGEVAIFNADGFTNAITTLGAAQAAQGLVFNGNASTGTLLGTLNDYLLTLGTSGIDVQGGTQLINSSIAVGGAQTWSNTGGGTLTVAGDVALNANLTLAGTGDISITGGVTATANRTLTLSNTLGNVSLGAISNSATLTFNTAAGTNLTVNGVISGASIHKDGTGTLTLNGANSFTGNLRILDGTVKVNASNTAAAQLIFGLASGAAGVNGFGTLTLDTNSAVVYRVNSTTYVHPTSDGALINSGGGGSFTPVIGLFGDRTFIVNETSAANDLTVEVGIANGDASNRGIIKQSVGTMVMRGANSYTGTTTVDRGMLVLDYSMNNSNSRLSDSAVTNLRGGILELWGNASAASAETIGSLAIVRANSTFSIVSNGQTVSVTLASGLSRSIGNGVVDFSSNDWSKTVITSTGGAANGSTGILGGWATVDGERWAAKNGSNEIVAVGTVLNDLSQWTSASHVVVDGTASGTLGTGEIASLILDAPAGGTVTINNATSVLTLGAGAILVSDNVTGDTTISGGQLMLKQAIGGQASEMIITNLSTGTLTISANLGSNNTPQSLQAQQLTFAGPGWILLTGTNNLGGHNSTGSSNQTSQVNIQGLVRVSGGNAITDYGTLVISSGAAMVDGAVLDLNGGSEGVGNLSGGGGGDNTYAEFGRGEIRLGTGGVLTVNQTGSSTLSARITGTNAQLIKKGSGTLTTTTNVEHTMSGELTVLGGLVDLTGANAGFTSITTIRLRGGQLRSEQNSTSASINKINNSAAIILEGTTGDGYRVTSNQNGTRTETAASLSLAGGANTLTLDNTAATTTAALTTMAFGGTTSFSRSNGSTMLVRGPNLGGTPSGSTDATRVTFTTATAINSYQTGTSTTAGATNLKILAFAIGENSPTGVGNTFLTVDSTVGNSLRTLTDLEYASDYAAAASDANLSLSATASSLASKTLNSLRIVSSGGSVDLTGDVSSTLMLTSGGLLVTAGATDNDVTISGFDSIQAGTSGASDDELVIHITSSNAAASGATLTLQSAVIDNGGATSLTKTGAGTLILGGTNSYTGATTINQGILEFGATGNLGSGMIRLSDGTLRWGTGNTTDITAGSRAVELLGASVYITPNFGGHILGIGSVFDVGANNVTLANAVGNNGYGGLTKTGAGTLTLSAAPTYTGATVVNQGALNFQTIAANTTEALYLIQTAGMTSGTISSTVQSGLNLQSLVVGGVYNSGPNVTATLTVLGGAVNIGDGGGDDFILIGYRDPTATQATTGNTAGTVNFSGASSVTINVNQIQMGIYNGAVPSPNSLRSTGSLTLSNGTNVITATSILMGSSPSAVVNTGASSTLNLGTGSTTINVDTFVIGGSRSKADVTIGSGGSFTLRGQQAGTTGANLFIGDNDIAGTGTPNVSSLNLTGASSVDMRLNLLVLGRLGQNTSVNGYGRGTLTYAVGSVIVDTIRMADANYTSAGTTPENTQGTITQSGTASMRFRDLSQGSGTATYNWQGGTIGNISGADLTNQNVTVTLNGSPSATDTTARTFDVETGRSATFEADAEIAGTGSFTKEGSGELIFKGVNTNTGNVRVSAGTLSLEANGSMDDAAWVNVEAGATFDISQHTDAAYTSDAVISGNGTIGGTGAFFVVGSNVGSTNTDGVLKPGSSSVVTGLASASTVGDQTGTLTVLGDLTLAGGGARVDRALLQVGTTTNNASSTFFTNYGGDTVTWVDHISTDFSSFLTGNDGGHDLIATSGSLTLNANGGITVATTGGYTGVFGDVFNLLDWSSLSTLTLNGFTIGNRFRDGTETGLDLLLPTLGTGLVWDTSMFESQGVLVVVPEPTRALLLLVGAFPMIWRRRR